MNSFERFKNRNSKHIEAQSLINTHFLLNGYSSTIITNTTYNNGELTTKKLQAAVVNQQEKDKAYVYTKLEDVLDMGSIWTAKTLHLLIAENIVIIKDVNWNKYLAYLCNIEVEDTWGYFKGPEKTYVNIQNEQGASLESLQKPILVLPENILGFADKIVINNRPWLVQEWDAISSPGLVYYSLRATTVSKEVAEKHAGEKVYIERVSNDFTPLPIEPEQSSDNEYTIANNVNITVATEEGYFKFNKKIDIKKHTATEVIFSIPFGITEVIIETKQGGAIVSKTFVVE